jgi:ribA/ribD-fused uncharacterized protein
MSTDEPIFFYGMTNNYGEFSNFWRASFTLDGAVWATSEHYFMGQKTLDPEEREAIRLADKPGDAKRMGRKVQLRPGWDEMKFDVMMRAVHAKFDQNPGIRDVLLSTGNRPLHENCRDPWWGGGPNFPKGRDWLGKVLHEVRYQLRQKYGDPSTEGLDEIVAGLE